MGDMKMNLDVWDESLEDFKNGNSQNIEEIVSEYAEEKVRYIINRTDLGNIKGAIWKYIGRGEHLPEGWEFIELLKN